MKIKHDKEPSLFKQLIAILFEQAKRRKALRILEKQAWSTDYLIFLMRKANLGSDVTFTVTNRFNETIKIHVDKHSSIVDPDDDIFNHLDDSVAIAKFIQNNSVR